MTTMATLNYFIDFDKGISYQVDVETTTSIRKVLDKIYDDQKYVFERHRLTPSQLDLYAPSDLKRKPAIDLRQRVTEWFLGDVLDICDEVGHVLNTGLDPNLVHIVVVPRPMVATGRPITLENKTPVILEGMPRKSREETQKLVDEFLGGNDARLARFLANPPWKDFWKVPQSAHHDTASFIDDLRIPQISGSPVLLLHDLGEKSIVDQGIVDNLFGCESWFLVNTSGSGKTRLLFEGLVKHWGFYFTAVSDSSNYQLGSVDMMDTIHRYIPRSRSFTRHPESLPKDLRDAAYDANHSVAERRVCQVLVARVLIFEQFLKIAQATCPTRDINEFKMHWLFLQLSSIDILGGDLFAKLCDLLTDASDEYLMVVGFEVHLKLFKMQEEFGLNKRFFFILDEAQEAIEQLHGCFHSKDVSIKRPVLRPIINTWVRSTRFPIIVSGTGLSMDVVNDILGSSVVKAAQFILATKTGAFDDRERQRKYIMRYMPPHVAGSDSGKEFLERAWQYVRGRHRFTAALLGELIKTSFAAPHRVLDAYVSIVSNFTPTDGQRFSEKEVGVAILDVLPLSFTKFTKDQRLIHVFSDLIHTWLLTQRLVDLAPKDFDLVQLGFARFVGSTSPKARVDEPLVLLAATHALTKKPGYSLQDHVTDSIRKIDGQDTNFERLVAHYLASVFDGKRELHEIFDFRENVPRWAKQRAEVVSVERCFDGRLRFNPFYLPEHLGGMMSIGYKSEHMHHTVDWFKNPTSLLCFPDNSMGPDIVLFIRLDSGEVVAVVVQCKWWNTKTLREDMTIKAAESLDPSEFFRDSTSRTPNAEKALASVLDMFKHLNGPESDIWFKHGVPILKVIASFPAVARNHIPPDCTILNMDPYVNLLEKTGVLKAVAEKFTRDKRAATPDNVITPNKRSRST